MGAGRNIFGLSLTNERAMYYGPFVFSQEVAV
jgi:hypothetical protein